MINVVSKYRAQSRAGSSNFSSILASRIQRGQKVIDNSQETQDELYDKYYQPSPKNKRKTDSIPQTEYWGHHANVSYKGN